MYKILITGASGFVGQNLVPYLSQHLQKVDLIPISIRYGGFITDKANVYIHLAGKAHDIRNTIEETDYYEANYLLTKNIYDAFLNDTKSECFIYMSSVKAIADNPGNQVVNEACNEKVETVYGKSKKLAEDYILFNQSSGKRVYILRPCMIHGPGNRGNLNLLYKLFSKNIPWPLGAFENKRSFCSIDNLMFIFKELIEREDIPSGIYNVADDEPLSTNELIDLIAQSQNRKPKIWKISKSLIDKLIKIGDKFHLPLNSERLQKLTLSYVASNAKIKAAIGKSFPVSSKEGLLKTFKSFNN